MLVQQAWAVEEPLFDVLLDAYRAAMSRLRRSQRVSLAKWVVPASLTTRWASFGYNVAKMKQMRKMSRYCLVQTHNNGKNTCLFHILSFHHAQDSNKAKLDGLPFTTCRAQRDLKTDNSYVYETYIDRDSGAAAVCYGRIQSIIEHRLFPESPEKNVLIECEWYSPTGARTPSGLLQVSHDQEMSAGSRWTFLKNMYKTNLVLWPYYTHTPDFHAIPDTYAVVLHTAVLADADSEDESSDSDAE